MSAGDYLAESKLRQPQSLPLASTDLLVDPAERKAEGDSKLNCILMNA